VHWLYARFGGLAMLGYACSQCTAWRLGGLEAMLVAMHVLAWRLGYASGVLAICVFEAWRQCLAFVPYACRLVGL